MHLHRSDRRPGRRPRRPGLGRHGDGAAHHLALEPASRKQLGQRFPRGHLADGPGGGDAPQGIGVDRQLHAALRLEGPQGVIQRAGGNRETAAGLQLRNGGGGLALGQGGRGAHPKRRRSQQCGRRDAAGPDAGLHIDPHSPSLPTRRGLRTPRNCTGGGYRMAQLRVNRILTNATERSPPAKRNQAWPWPLLGRTWSLRCCSSRERTAGGARALTKPR